MLWSASFQEIAQSILFFSLSLIFSALVRCVVDVESVRETSLILNI